MSQLGQFHLMMAPLLIQFQPPRKSLSAKLVPGLVSACICIMKIKWPVLKLPNLSWLVMMFYWFLLIDVNRSRQYAAVSYSSSTVKYWEKLETISLFCTNSNALCESTFFCITWVHFWCCLTQSTLQVLYSYSTYINRSI